MSAQDLPQVTLYGDPGGRWWVASREEGRFTLRLAQPAPADAAFGYLILR
jgi:hypothetical protein